MIKHLYPRSRYTIYLLLVLCIFNLSCRQKQIQTEIPSIFIEIPSKKQSIDSLFSKIELIKLDTLNGGILNFISSADYMNNKIYIRQMSTSEIFAYDSCGKFNFKISDQGNGHNEYNGMTDFITNPLNNTLLILDNSDLHQYDALGKHIKHIRIAPTGDGRLAAVFPHSLDKYICILDLKWSMNYDIFSVNDMSTTSVFSDPLPINVLIPFYQFNNQLYHYKWYDNTVYKVEDDASLTPHYMLDFTDGADVSIPSSITDDYEFENAIMKKGVCFDKIQENSRYILIEIVQTINNEPKRETIIYDKLRRQSFNIYNFKENISIGRSLKITEDGYIMGIINSEDLKNSIDVELLDPASQKIYNQISDYDNPVIVKSKLR